MLTGVRVWACRCVLVHVTGCACLGVCVCIVCDCVGVCACVGLSVCMGKYMSRYNFRSIHACAGIVKYVCISLSLLSESHYFQGSL